VLCAGFEYKIRLDLGTGALFWHRLRSLRRCSPVCPHLCCSQSHHTSRCPAPLAACVCLGTAVLRCC
jgi:hypothetical protein